MESGIVSRQELTGGGVGDATQFAVEIPPEQERFAQHLRDRVHDLRVWGIGEDFFDQPLGPEEGALLAT